MSEGKPPLPGRIVGYALAVVVVAAAARATWELLQPLLPVLVTLVALAGIYCLIFGRLRL
jgi:MFS superfamily sulfate permease-like transporter